LHFTEVLLGLQLLNTFRWQT